MKYVLAFCIPVFSAFAMNQPAASPIESKHVKFINTVEASNIEELASDFFTESALLEVNFDDNFIVSALLYHQELKTIVSTYDEVRSGTDYGCLTINGYLPDASRVTLLYQYKELEQTPKIHKVHIAYLENGDSFTRFGQCPHEFTEDFFQD